VFLPANRSFKLVSLENLKTNFKRLFTDLQIKCKKYGASSFSRLHFFQNGMHYRFENRVRSWELDAETGNWKIDNALKPCCFSQFQVSPLKPGSTTNFKFQISSFKLQVSNFSIKTRVQKKVQTTFVPL